MFSYKISIKSFDFYFTRKTVEKILQILSFLEINEFTIINLPQKKKKITVLRSPHIDKKSREQFQLEKKKTVLYIKTNTRKKGFLFLEILKHLILAGVEIQISATYSKYF